MKTNSKSEKKVFTTGEIAKYCGVHFRTVIRWIDQGRLSAYKLPGRGDHRVPVTALINFLQQNEMPIPEELAPNKRRILVVEDEIALAKTIERILKIADYEVEIAENGFIAGVKLMNFKPSLMILDLRMPGLDGFQMLNFVRNQNINELKILVVSAECESNLKRALADGADAALAKPFDPEQLLAEVKQLLPE